MMLAIICLPSSRTLTCVVERHKFNAGREWGRKRKKEREIWVRIG